MLTARDTVVRLAKDALEEFRHRVQQHTCGHRGHQGDAQQSARRTLRTGTELLTEKQQHRLTPLCAADRPRRGRCAHAEALRDCRPDHRRAGSDEPRTLDRTLIRSAADVLVCFDRPRTSTGPTDAVNGRLEHLRGAAPGFHRTHDITGGLLEPGGRRPRLHPGC